MAIEELFSLFTNGRARQEVTSATVVRVSPDGVWVHIEGGADDTPVKGSYSDVSVGDVVSVTIRGGVAYITGNATEPSVGGAYVRSEVEPVAEAVGDMVDKVRRIIERNAVIEKLVGEAKEIAEAVNQYFWHRSDDPDGDGAGTGAFVTDVTQDDFLAAAAQDFPDVSDSKPYHNMLMTSIGFLLRTAKNNLVALTRSSITFYDGLGNAASNIVAFFGRDGAQIGRAGQSHAEIDYHSLRIVDRNGDTYMHVSDLRDVDGCITDTFTGDGTSDTFNLRVAAVGNNSTVNYTVKVDGVVCTSSQVTLYTTYFVFNSQHIPSSGKTVEAYYRPSDTPRNNPKSYTFGVRKEGTKIGAMSHAEGYDITASGWCSHAEGYYTRATGERSHAEGWDTQASGYASHAEGIGAKASGYCSHAEGRGRASGEDSHAEGSTTYAIGDGSHAEGITTYAEGDSSHAEGGWTKASGAYSHAQNYFTIAAYDYQTAMGCYNDNDANNLLEVGNGTSDSARSNAMAVTRAGELELGSDVDWTDLTLSSACQQYDSSSKPQYRKVCHVVELVGAVKPKSHVTAGNTLQVGTLPEGCRPSKIMYFVCHADGMYIYRLVILATGVVQAQRYRNSSTAAAIPTTAELRFNVSFCAR